MENEKWLLSPSPPVGLNYPLHYFGKKIRLNKTVCHNIVSGSDLKQHDRVTRIF